MLVIVSRPRRHDQRTVGTEGGTERLDQAERPSLDRSYGSEGRVHEQDATPLDSKRAELVGYIGSTQFKPCGLALHHAPPLLLILCARREFLSCHCPRPVPLNSAWVGVWTVHIACSSKR